jgi:hypothetical protein
MKTGKEHIDYKTHILIGVRADGVMSIIEDWEHLPMQSDVQEAIDGTRGSYVNFALCTPTSILPGKDRVEEVRKMSSRFGTWPPMRRP